MRHDKEDDGGLRPGRLRPQPASVYAGPTAEVPAAPGSAQAGVGQLACERGERRYAAAQRADQLLEVLLDIRLYAGALEMNVWMSDGVETARASRRPTGKRYAGGRRTSCRSPPPSQIPRRLGAEEALEDRLHEGGTDLTILSTLPIFLAPALVVCAALVLLGHAPLA